MAESKSLKTAVKREVKEAATTVETGNLVNQPQTTTGPKAPKGPVDLPTNARSHPPE